LDCVFFRMVRLVFFFDTPSFTYGKAKAVL
jgi:hypothetical protein